MPFETFNAGDAERDADHLQPVSVHGNVFATATVDGKPYALSRQRSTFGRDGLNLAALKDMTEGKASTPRRFWDDREPVRLHLQLGLRLAQGDRLLQLRAACRVRARGLDRRLPTLGTGDYEWKGFLSQNEHPHDVCGPAACC